MSKDKKYRGDQMAWPGGQGAKTACLLLADVAFSSGKQVQGFPEYGPERMRARRSRHITGSLTEEQSSFQYI